MIVSKLQLIFFDEKREGGGEREGCILKGETIFRFG
jgi:hypothetical protein